MLSTIPHPIYNMYVREIEMGRAMEINFQNVIFQINIIKAKQYQLLFLAMVHNPWESNVKALK